MNEKTDRVVHCWKDQREHIEETEEPYSPEWCASWKGERDASCLLEDGHAGPHVFTQDSSIVIGFAPVEEWAS